MQIESNDCKENRFYLLMEHDVAVCICNGGGFLSCESKFVSLLPHSVDLNGTRHQYSCVRLCMNTTFFFRYFVGDAQADAYSGATIQFIQQNIHLIRLSISGNAVHLQNFEHKFMSHDTGTFFQFYP